MKPKFQRLYFLSLLLISFSIGCGLLLYNLKDNLVYFYSPTEVLKNIEKINKKIRVGGLVKKNSIKRSIQNSDGIKVENITFEISDLNKTLKISYIGILPDLFKEEQGVVVEGYIVDKILKAEKVLAKHDENYMPPEISDIINKGDDS